MDVLNYDTLYSIFSKITDIYDIYCICRVNKSWKQVITECTKVVTGPTDIKIPIKFIQLFGRVGYVNPSIEINSIKDADMLVWMGVAKANIFVNKTKHYYDFPFIGKRINTIDIKSELDIVHYIINKKCPYYKVDYTFKMSTSNNLICVNDDTFKNVEPYFVSSIENPFNSIISCRDIHKTLLVLLPNRTVSDFIINALRQCSHITSIFLMTKLPRFCMSFNFEYMGDLIKLGLTQLRIYNNTQISGGIIRKFIGNRIDRNFTAEQSLRLHNWDFLPPSSTIQLLDVMLFPTDVRSAITKYSSLSVVGVYLDVSEHINQLIQLIPEMEEHTNITKLNIYHNPTLSIEFIKHIHTPIHINILSTNLNPQEFIELCNDPLYN